MSHVWKSTDDRSLEELQKINELLYGIQNHQKKISAAQVTEMSVIISLLGKIVNKLEKLEKGSIKEEDDL
tara:strand:+ start:3344 stop:3553 length:210 start_codon:yes stop_codon:yes gene_type:complete